MPLVTNDEYPEEDEAQDQQEPIEQFTAKTIQTGTSFKNLLAGLGGWLARRKLPDSAKQGLKEFGQEIWYSEKELRQRRSVELKQKQKMPQKFMARPFKSFGPKNNKKKGKL